MELFINRLRSELEKRKIKNTKYSLRSFARLLHEEPSFLSKILTGKRQLSVQKVWQYGEKLSIPQSDLEKIVAQMAAKKNKDVNEIKPLTILMPINLELHFLQLVCIF